MDDLFEVITADEFHEAKAQTSKGLVTEPRNFTTWIGLPSRLGFCTVPDHDEIQKMLSPEQKEYRQVYPTRMVTHIGDYDVCRDCFLRRADEVKDVAE